VFGDLDKVISNQLAGGVTYGEVLEHIITTSYDDISSPAIGKALTQILKGVQALLKAEEKAGLMDRG
jgi:hypothetical protein